MAVTGRRPKKSMGWKMETEGSHYFGVARGVVEHRIPRLRVEMVS